MLFYTVYLEASEGSWKAEKQTYLGLSISRSITSLTGVRDGLLEDKENVRGLIEILADRIAAEIDFTRLTQLNRSFVSETLREQESDLIFSVPFHGGPEDEELMIYILIEHQSTVDVAMGFRMLFYMTQLWDSQRREWGIRGYSKRSVAFASDSADRPLHRFTALEYHPVAYQYHGDSRRTRSFRPDI